jgi:predicted permease
LFSGVVILVLALGIGATTAIFTLVDAVVISPLPFEKPEQLVSIQHFETGTGFGDAGQCAAWHFTYVDEAQVFQHLGMWWDDQALLAGGGHPEAVRSMEVTEGVLDALGLIPLAGRIFTATDMAPGSPPTVILAEGYWQSRYGSDPGVIGQTLEADGASREIVGVIPKEIRAVGEDPSVILPLQYDRSTLFVGNQGARAVGRLKAGVSIEAAAADLNRVLPLAWEKFPGGPVASSSNPDHFRAQVIPFQKAIIGPIANILWILLAGVGLVLLIACANVANLFLVRADGKEGEMAIRTAMGASGRRIGWEYLKESLILGVLGGAGGLVLAQVSLRSLLAMAPASLPRMDEIGVDARVLLFTALIALASALVFGSLPVLRQGRGNPVGALKEGGRGGMRTRKRNRAQNLLAMSQMALALVLLVSSGLLLKTFNGLRHVDPGFRNPENVQVLRLYIPPNEIRSSAEVASAYEAIVRRIQEVPGVESAGYATQIPMDGTGNVNPFFVRGRVDDPAEARTTRRHKWITEGYLETLQIPLLTGRSITWDDIHNRAPVALLSETLAREVFGSPEAAMGQFIAARPDPPVWKEVIGIVKDVREFGMEQDPPAMVYWPQVTLGFWEGNAPDQVQTWRSAGLAIRSDRVGTPGFRTALEEAIWDVDPNLPILRVHTLSALMANSMAALSFTLVLLGIAGGVALFLGLVGVYGVISYTVSQRTRELGMRMALGAEGRQILAMVARQGATLAGIGILVGLALAFSLTRLMTSILYDVSPADPGTYIVTATGLLAVALLASFLPAIRASRVDPVEALRAE